MASSNLVQIVASLAFTVPLLAVYLIGGLIAFRYWRRAPGPAMLTLLAMVLLFIGTTVSVGVSVSLPHLMSEMGWQPDAIGLAFRVVGLLHSLLTAGALVMLLVAVFSGR